jgi:hypothetical protein
MSASQTIVRGSLLDYLTTEDVQSGMDSCKMNFHRMPTHRKIVVLQWFFRTRFTFTNQLLYAGLMHPPPVGGAIDILPGYGSTVDSDAVSAMMSARSASSQLHTAVVDVMHRLLVNARERMFNKEDAAASELVDRICSAAAYPGTEVGVIGDMAAFALSQCSDDDAMEIMAMDLFVLTDARMGLEHAAIRQALLEAAM